MDINKKIQAASHSGAKLSVIQEDGDYFVLKSVKDAIEKNRLGIQKQAKFKSVSTPSYEVSAIPIKKIEHSEETLSIIMPYIEGLGGEHVAYKGSKTVAKNLKTALDFYLINALASSEDGIFPITSIHEKIEDIEAKVQHVTEQFPLLSQHLKSFKQFCSKDLQLPIGDCHGDLTLSNLKVTEENHLYLFDFLSCDINSPLQDAAKLIQDFEYGWSFRREKESIRVKGEIFCEYAYPSFLNTLNRLFNYEMRVIETLTILRIAPYIKSHDHITISWFNDVMVKSMNKISR